MFYTTKNLILQKIKELLKKDGVFFVGMKEGDSEGYQENPRYPNHRRYISLYEDQEFRGLLEKYFEILHMSRVMIDKDHVYLNYLCKVKY